MSSFCLSGTTAFVKRYYRSEFEFPRSGPCGRRAVLPLEVPLEVPQWGPNLTGSKAVPERYQSGTAVTSYGTWAVPWAVLPLVSGTTAPGTAEVP